MVILNMTNEELAIKAKGRDKEAIAELWENVKKICFQKANLFFNSHKNKCASCGVELDDCNQAAFFALLDAIRGFNPESSWKFTAFLNLPLKNCFNELIGIRGSLAPRTLNHCTSLDVSTLQDGNGTLENILPDTESEEVYVNSDKRMYLQSLLATIPEKQRQVIVLDFFYGFTQEEIAKQFGVSRCYISKLKLMALKNMKATAEKQGATSG